MGLNIFMSYSSGDSSYFRIPYIAEKLKLYPEIDEVLYWQDSARRSIIKYMNDNISKCDVFLLFCSPKALKSKPVEMEWQAALKLEKILIPIFFNEDHIPPLITSNLGVFYDPYYFDEKIEELHQLILKEANITEIEKPIKVPFTNDISQFKITLGIPVNIIKNIPGVTDVFILEKIYGMNLIHDFKELVFNVDLIAGFTTALLSFATELYKGQKPDFIISTNPRGTFLIIPSGTLVLGIFFDNTVSLEKIISKHLDSLKLVCSGLPELYYDEQKGEDKEEEKEEEKQEEE